MIRHTFIKKCNTIFKNSNINFGNNPISMLHGGKTVSRILLEFDVDKIKNEFGAFNNATHILKMANCNSIIFNDENNVINGFYSSGERQRAVSFDIIAFAIPEFWDEGIGLDSPNTKWEIGEKKVSIDGSNWFQAYNGKPWANNGIYSSDFISSEYDKFSKGEKSIIISRQHFDKGNENLEMDITSFINDILNNNIKNNGICLAFTPLNEGDGEEVTKYVGFFNNHTNTFFQPYIESKTISPINDNRCNFILGKKNMLGLYVKIGNKFTDLDELPICTIENKEYPVKKVKNGHYMAEVLMNTSSVKPNTIFSDIWSNIKIDGIPYEDVEMEFITKSNFEYVSIGRIKDKTENFLPLLVGINEMEKINKGEKREVKVYFKEEYTHDKYELLDSAFYRIYTMFNNKEVTVIPWDYINILSDYNSFTLYADDFLPQKYYVDIKVNKGSETKLFKRCLEFEIPNEF